MKTLIKNPTKNPVKSQFHRFPFFLVSGGVLPALSAFLQSLQQDVTYICYIQLRTQDRVWISLTRQVFITPSKFQVETLLTLVEANLEIHSEKYNVKPGDFIVIKYKEYETPQPPLPVVPLVDSQSSPESPRISDRLPINSTFRKFADIRAHFMSKKYWPLSIYPEDYGLIISRTVAGGSLVITHQYTEDITIERHYLVSGKAADNSRMPAPIGRSVRSVVYKNGITILEYTDYIYLDRAWRRKMNDLSLLFNSNGELIKWEAEYKVKFIEGLVNPSETKKKGVVDKGYIVLDIETYVDPKSDPNLPDALVPYALGIYDGKNTRLYHMADFESSAEMIKTVFLDLSKTHNNSTIFIHNFSNFDSVFLMQPLIHTFDMKCIIKNGRLLSLYLTSKLPDNAASYKTKRQPKIKLHLRDSYMLIPVALREAGMAFKVPTQKLHFPYKFITKERLSYIGPTPDYKYYNHEELSEITYLENIQDNWDCRQEALKYLEADLKCLYEVLRSFNQIIYEKTNLHPLNYLSISSLALAIIRTNYFSSNENKLPILKGLPNINIRKSFFGGCVEVYAPILKKGHAYDINGFYSEIMLLDMPVGAPVYTTEPNLFEIFGFVYAEVEIPTNINKPPLPFRREDNTIIFPTGKFKGWYFSEELKMAVLENGAKVKVIEGYKFKRDNTIFKDFVLDFDEMKRNSEGPMKLISKLILNSPFGRLGMQDIVTKTELLKSKKSDTIAAMYPILEHKEISPGFELIKYILEPDPGICKQTGIDYFSLILGTIEYDRFHISSVGIASAIAAYGRMIINLFKNLPGNTCYYSDTDSIVLAKPLDDKWVSDKTLGLFKLIGKVNLGIFIDPKTYYMLMDDGKEIKKSKGLGSYLTRRDYWKLYNSNPITVQKEKWGKDYAKGYVYLASKYITIKQNMKKRLPIIINGQWVGTSPLHINYTFKGTSIIIRPIYAIIIRPPYALMIPPTYALIIRPTYSLIIRPTYPLIIRPTYPLIIRPTYPLIIRPAYAIIANYPLIIRSEYSLIIPPE